MVSLTLINLFKILLKNIRIFSKIVGFLDFPNFWDLDKWFGTSNICWRPAETAKHTYQLCGWTSARGRVTDHRQDLVTPSTPGQDKKGVVTGGNIGSQGTRTGWAHGNGKIEHCFQMAKRVGSQTNDLQNF